MHLRPCLPHVQAGCPRGHGGDPQATRAGRDQSPPQHPETSILGSTRSQEHQANQDGPEGSQPAGQVQQQLGRGSKNCSFTPQKSEFAHHLSKKCGISAIITLLLAACSPGGFGHGVLQHPFPIDVKGEALTADNLISFSGIHLPTAKKGVLPPNFTPSPPPRGAAEVTPQREVSQAPFP